MTDNEMYQQQRICNERAERLEAYRKRVESLETELAEARKDGERLARAREILFAYTDNEITSDPWWCVVRNGSFGRMVVLEGPFFSRERAEELRNARLYEYGAKSYVFCFSGYRSQHYKDLRSVVGAPARGPR